MSNSEIRPNKKKNEYELDEQDINPNLIDCGGGEE
jgi:hypothetical protein